MHNPEITVLMPVKNSEQYIKESVESVLRQTLEDFEFIIIDDDSTDGTIEIIESYKDKRIKLFKRASGYIKNLNEGFTIATGKYIACMGSNDIMYSERLRVQLKRMKMNPEVDICASWAKTFGIENVVYPIFNLGERVVSNPILKFLSKNFIVHHSVMLKKNFLIDNSLKYQDYLCTEDYKLWFEAVKKGGVFYIEPQYLMYLRLPGRQTDITNQEQMNNQIIRIKNEILEYLISNSEYSKTLSEICKSTEILKRNGLILPDELFSFFYNILNKEISKNN